MAGPAYSGEGAHSTRGTGRDAVDAQRSRYGGIKWGAAFFGWLSANGLAVLLVALLSAAGVAIGLTQGVPGADEATEQADTIGIVGGIVLLAILFLAYLAGGYVAGRMARFDGARNGLLSGVLFVLVTAGLGAAAAADDRVRDLGLPSWTGLDSARAVVTALVALALALGAATLGGMLGSRWHRRADSVLLGTRPGGVLPYPSDTDRMETR